MYEVAIMLTSHLDTHRGNRGTAICSSDIVYMA